MRSNNALSPLSPRRLFISLAAATLVFAGFFYLMYFTRPAEAAISVFINEIHYDNTGTDAGEAIEIAGPAGTDLTGWSIVLYNGFGGAVYDTDALSGIIPNQQNGFGTVFISYPSNGIQNGSPDGIALVNASNVVVQFLSYEGSFTAVGGPANGMVSTDIGVSENGSEPLGQSLRLSGSGQFYEDFTWNAPAAHTFGAVNTGQTFGNVDAAPSVTNTSPKNGNTGIAVGSNISITFSESVNASNSSFIIECPTGSPQGFTLSSSPSTTFTLDPTTDLPQNSTCTVTVLSNQISDADTNDPPDNMTANFVFSFTTADDQVADFVIINELDSDTPGTDAAEFVELYDGGVGNTSLNGLVLVFYNGSNDLSYRAIDLDGFTTNASGYFTAGNAAVPGVDVTFPNNTLQNGEDAVALYVGNASNFPNGTLVTTNSLADAIVYDTNDPDDPGLLVLLNTGQCDPQVDEDSGGQADTVSNSRCPNGSGGQRNTLTYKQRSPTPDAANDCAAPPVFKTVPEIQGNGGTSPFAGLDVITTGIVTAKKSNGFFLQTSDADAALEGDPATSQALFVFTSCAPPVTPGDAVTVTGTAMEFFQLTQISAETNNVSVSSSGNPLPTPITLTTTILDPADLPDQLERFEGMRMHADTLVSVAPTNEFGETFTVLDGVPRPLREPGIEISLTVPSDPSSTANVPRWDENPERIMIDSDGLVGSSVISVTSNVTLSNITGPLDFTFGDYKVLPETPPTVTTANMSAVPVPTPVAGEFTVAGFNIENFNNGATQRAKAALAIRDVLHLPDIIGTIEIFELSGLEALADEIEAISGVHYEARLVEADGTAGDADQDVGFLIKTARVQIDSVTQEELAGCDGTPANCNTFTDPNTLQPALLNDRPPLVLRATVDPFGANPTPVIVVVNHTRSFIDIEDLGAEGARVRAKRKAQAEFLASLLQELQTDNPNTPVMSIGDYNAYQFSDGYTDPVATIKGTPTPDDEIVVDASPDLVNPDFINLTDGLPADQRYSFIFEGTPQAIDHMILNTVANAMFQRYAVARNNSDFPELPSSLFSGDATRPERCSDHDMPVAYFKPLADLSISKSASPEPVVAGSNVTYTINVTNNGPNTAQAVVVSDNLPAETSFVSCNSTLGGTCGGTGNSRTITFSSLSPGASATITLVAKVDCSVDIGQIISNTASVDSATDDPDSGNDSDTVMVTVLSPQQVVQNMIDTVAGFSNLSGGQKQGLTSKLEAALDALNSGKTKIACNKLNDFISQVQALINNGSLTPAQGEGLIDSAQRVRNAIGCTNGVCT